MIDRPHRKLETGHNSQSSATASKGDTGSAAKRSNPFIWVSWLSKLMAGEKQCEWASWFRSHYIWQKLPSGLDVAKWTAGHAQLLRARKAVLEAEGFTVYAEDQNSFKLKGKAGIEVSGKPDIVAIRGSEAYVEDCKTGTPRHSDHFQVLVYMLALPHVDGPCKGRKLEGRIVYGSRIVDVPSSRIDTELKGLFRKTVLMIGGSEPPAKVPSWGECRYCDISTDDCPERIDIENEAVTDHGLF
jgi:PD-(D/E)XK nuclease superfamily protein